MKANKLRITSYIVFISSYEIIWLFPELQPWLPKKGISCQIILQFPSHWDSQRRVAHCVDDFCRGNVFTEMKDIKKTIQTPLGEGPWPRPSLEASITD